MPRPESLCERCAYEHDVVSKAGSRFLLCERSRSDPRFPKYPSQPVTACEGFGPRPAENAG